MNELSTERAIEALYTIRAYYASLTAGYPKGKDRRGIGDVMCSEIANSCLMAIKALEQTEPERKRGKWEWDQRTGEYVCSECGCNPIYERTTPDCSEIDKYKFCRWCGAEMKGEHT